MEFNLKKVAYGLAGVIVLAVLLVFWLSRNPLFGKWVAVEDRSYPYRLAATPLGQIEFKDDHLVLMGSKVPCEYNVSGNKVTVRVAVGAGPGEMFVVEGADRMVRNIPSIGQIVYKKQ